MSALSVLVVCRHHDSRAKKQALALLSRGVKVYLLTGSVGWPLERFHQVFQFDDDEGIRRVVQEVPVDLVHTHDKPDRIATVAGRTAQKRGLPWVHDAHDLDIVRWGKTDPHELNILREPDAMVFPSESILESAVQEWLGPGAEPPWPCLALPPYTNQEFYVYEPQSRVEGVVYEGNVIDLDAESLEKFPYYELRFFAKMFKDWGIPFHLYPGGATTMSRYRELYRNYAEVHNWIPYQALIPALSAYDWGFFGHWAPDRQLVKTHPNKVFDYMAAGIPPVTAFCTETEKLLEPKGIGIRLKGWTDLEQLKDLDLLAHHKEKVLEGRDDFAMEAHIHRLIELYDRTLNRGSMAGSSPSHQASVKAGAQETEPRLVEGGIPAE